MSPARLLGDDSPRSLTLATLFGVASSSCSYAAVALARSIFRKGASVTAAMVFELASTNLVIELAVPDNPQWLLAGAGEGLYLSRNGGGRWERRLMLSQSAGAAFAWEPGNPHVLFAGVVAGGAGGSMSVYISRDAGLTWRLFGKGLQSGGGIMSLLATQQNRVFAGTMGHAIWSASLAHEIWRRVASGMPVTNDHVAGIAGIPGQPGTVFVGTVGQGVFRTIDGARHWTNISAGLPKSANATIVLSVAYSPQRHVLYAGTVDGIYELSTGG